MRDSDCANHLVPWPVVFMKLWSPATFGGVAIALLAFAMFRLLRSHDVSRARAANAAGRNLAGKTAIVVGGTSGIGLGIALRLAGADANVVIVGRDAERGRAIVARLSQLGTGGVKAQHEFVQCDATRLSAIQSCASALALRKRAVDVLVQSQGMATIAGRNETPEGLDAKLALHFYGRAAFVEALLPSLRAAGGDARALSVLSAGVHSAYAHLADDPELRSHFTLKNAADAAGFYNDLYVDALSRAPGNEGITFAHAAPGFVSTSWGTEMPWWLRAPIRVLQGLGRSLEDCGEAMSVPLLAPPAPMASASRFVLVDKDGFGPVATLPEHTAAARDTLWSHTRDVLRRAGVREVPVAGGGSVSGAPLQ